MSEYWVSRKKYFCKYCNIYIADDAPSRQQHENGLRHKGNKERFVRNLYKQGERHKKDLEEEKREMARIEKAANEAYARDISLGHASSSSSRTPPATAPSQKAPPPKPTSKFANYSDAKSLGFTDPDEERRQAELERRRTEGVVGNWEIVAPPPPELPTLPAEEETDIKTGVTEGIVPQKREAEGPVDDEDHHRWKLRKKTLQAGLGEIWDPGEIPIVLKPKKTKDEGSPATQAAQIAGASTTEDPGKSVAMSDEAERPKWTPKGWKKATLPAEELTNLASQNSGQEVSSEVVSKAFTGFEGPSKVEPASQAELTSEVMAPEKESRDVFPPDTNREEVKPEPEPLSLPSDNQAAGLFKKRKIPAGGGRSGGRR